MKIQFNQPKYVIPLIIFPFTFLGFYVYQDLFAGSKPMDVQQVGLQESVAAPSPEVVEKELNDKLSAYRQHYREADGYTAIGEIVPDVQQTASFDDLYSEKEKARLDSLAAVLQDAQDSVAPSKGRRPAYDPPVSKPEESLSESDRLLLEVLSQGNAEKAASDTGETLKSEQEDPIQLMRMQYALLDSFQKANDPEYRARLEQENLRKAKEQERIAREERNLSVRRPGSSSAYFTTIKSRAKQDHIKAIIDEELVGYAGSRVRIRLLEPVLVGDELLPKGTCLYALISGFGSQRVQLQISSVKYQDQIMPVNLSVYDLDGMAGLYVPQSAFREFSQELGSNSIQGMNMTTSSEEEQSQFLMSGVQKAFQSTSQAVSKAIRKNKVRLKYSTFVYLIDEKQMRQNNSNRNYENIP